MPKLIKFLKIAGVALLVLVALVLIVKSLTSVFRLSTETADVMQFASESAGMGVVSNLKGMPLDSRGEMGLGVNYDESLASPEAASSVVSAEAINIDKKIIKTGLLNLKVEKAEQAAESISQMAKAAGGEVYSSNFNQSIRGTKSGYITIRVPSQNYEKVFAQIKTVASQVVSESSNAQDITKDYIDLEARLKNKQAEEQSFVALLNRAGKIEEVLSVTREVARVRGEIEQLEGTKRYYDAQTDMSLITVDLSEDEQITPVSQDWRPWQVIKVSVRQLLTSGQNFIDGLIRFIIVVLPLLAIYFFIIWLIYFIGKKIYRKFKKQV